MPIEICKKENCTGCFACMNICPKNAITAGEDEYAKTIPLIDKDKCIECGLCVKVCPANQQVELSYPKKCYAAWGKDESERKDCSSGGVASILSKAVINEKGIVYGAAFNHDLKLTHMGAESESEIQKFKGSKYVQSYIGFSFRQIKEQLKTGRMVLFVGTPCQVAGLKSYLGKEYENLLMIDIVCHGTPPMKYLKEYMETVDPKKRATNITFRGKKDYCFTLYNENKVFYSMKSSCDVYFYAFLKGLIHRDNCYECQWAKAERCSDITIGDFWGLEKESLKEPYTGKVSVVLINTLLGEKFWEKYKKFFDYEERTVREAVAGNAQLKRPSICHSDRERFLSVYKREGFVKAVKTPQICREIRKGKVRSTTLYKNVRKVKKKIFS